MSSGASVGVAAGISAAGVAGGSSSLPPAAAQSPTEQAKSQMAAVVAAASVSPFMPSFLQFPSIFPPLMDMSSTQALLTLVSCCCYCFCCLDHPKTFDLPPVSRNCFFSSFSIPSFSFSLLFRHVLPKMLRFSRFYVASSSSSNSCS